MTTNDAQQPHLSLRPLTKDDFPLLLAWLAEPHVKEWWDDGDDTLEKVGFQYDSTLPSPPGFVAYMMKISFY